MQHLSSYLIALLICYSIKHTSQWIKLQLLSLFSLRYFNPNYFYLQNIITLFRILQISPGIFIF